MTTSFVGDDITVCSSTLTRVGRPWHQPKTVASLVNQIIESKYADEPHVQLFDVNFNSIILFPAPFRT